MAFLAVQLNVCRMTSQKADVEYWMSIISEKRTRITDAISSLQAGEGALALDDPSILRLQKIDKALEIQLKKYESIQQALSTSLDSYAKLLQNNIKREYKFEFS